LVCEGGLEERLRFIRSPALPGTELKAVYESGRRWHAFLERYAFVVCRTAGASVRYRGRDQSICDGTLVAREPGEAHSSTVVTKPADFKVLFVEAPVMADAARELGYKGTLHFPPVPINDSELFELLRRLCDAIEHGSDGLEQQYLFTAAMAALARHAERPLKATGLRKGKLAVARAQAYLSEHYSEPVSLHELARVSGLSRFGLVHAFTRQVGLSPHAYQVHIRIERGRRLLQHGLSPAEVAAALGFADHSHFTRHFKRILQVTPSQYARPGPGTADTLLYGPSADRMKIVVGGADRRP
jgi:AraC-like DNA-binding protein